MLTLLAGFGGERKKTDSGFFKKTTSDCKPGSVFAPGGAEAIIRLDVRLPGTFISNLYPKV